MRQAPPGSTERPAAVMYQVLASTDTRKAKRKVDAQLKVCLPALATPYVRS